MPDAEPVIPGRHAAPDTTVTFLCTVFRRPPSASPSWRDSRIFSMNWPVIGRAGEWRPVPGAETEVYEALDAETGELVVLARAPFMGPVQRPRVGHILRGDGTEGRRGVKLPVYADDPRPALSEPHRAARRRACAE